MTIFTHENALNASVYDIDTGEQIKYVESIDTEAMELVVFEHPFRVEHERVVTYAINYRAIHPIYGGGRFPCLFHCYGRI